MTEAGLVVTVERSSPPSPVAVPSAVDVSAFRVVQEALTNTLRHAGPGTPVHVRLEQQATSLIVEVQDSGGSNPTQLPNPDGHGLRGMTERASLLGGSIEAGRNPDGSFGVLATFPLVGPRHHRDAPHQASAREAVLQKAVAQEAVAQETA